MNQVRKCSPGLISNIRRLSAFNGVMSQDADCNWETKPSPPGRGPESDAGFREYLLRLSHADLRILGVIEIAAALLMAGPYTGQLPVRLWVIGVIVLTGVVTLALSGLRWIRKPARRAAAISAWTALSALLWCLWWKPAGPPGAGGSIPAAIALIVLGAAAIVPFRPWHGFVLGIPVAAVYTLSVQGQTTVIFPLALPFLAAGVAAANYRRHADEYAAHVDAVRAADALGGAQLRAQLAENATSIGKMAAALSHEINSPLGTLRSSIETLVALTDRQGDASPETRGRLAETRADLCRSIEESAARIGEVTSRLRHFAGLDETEVKPADLKELLADVALLHDQALRDGGVRLEFDLEQLPPLDCRPQLLTAAFSALLSNAIAAVNGNGRIRITARRRGGEVEVTIRDNGRGMAPEEADSVFDPSFKTDGHRVASGNWSLFNARQIVYEHGGEIRLETAPGKGTAVCVILPVNGNR